MIEAYSVEQIRAVEAIALDREGDGVLMRRASYAVALEVAERVPAPGMTLYQHLTSLTSPDGAAEQQFGGRDNLRGIVQIEYQGAGQAIRRRCRVAQFDHRGVTQQIRGRGRIRRAGGKAGGHRWNPVGAQHRQRFVLRERQLSRDTRVVKTAPDPAPLGRQLQHRAGGQFARRLTVAAVSDQMLEAPHRLIGRCENRQARVGESRSVNRTGGLSHGTDQQRCA